MGHWPAALRARTLHGGVVGSLNLYTSNVQRSVRPGPGSVCSKILCGGDIQEGPQDRDVVESLDVPTEKVWQNHGVDASVEGTEVAACVELDL